MKFCQNIYKITIIFFANFQNSFITQKSFFNIQHSYTPRIISGNWKSLKNHEKHFLFHLNKLNMLLENQILHILCIFMKPNVWYSWKYWPLKDGFRLISAKTLQGHHLMVGGPRNVKLLEDICFQNSLQNVVLSSLLLFLRACY